MADDHEWRERARRCYIFWISRRVVPGVRLCIISRREHDRTRQRYVSGIQTSHRRAHQLVALTRRHIASDYRARRGRRRTYEVNNIRIAARCQVGNLAVRHLNLSGRPRSPFNQYQPTRSVAPSGYDYAAVRQEGVTRKPKLPVRSYNIEFRSQHLHLRTLAPCVQPPPSRLVRSVVQYPIWTPTRLSDANVVIAREADNCDYGELARER